MRLIDADALFKVFLAEQDKQITYRDAARIVTEFPTARNTREEALREVKRIIEKEEKFNGRFPYAID